MKIHKAGIIPIIVMLAFVIVIMLTSILMGWLGSYLSLQHFLGAYKKL